MPRRCARAGYDVLVAHYRGSWGVPGDFSFTHAIEDADAQLDWISSPAVVAKYHIDPARVVGNRTLPGRIPGAVGGGASPGHRRCDQHFGSVPWPPLRRLEAGRSGPGSG